MRELEPSRTWIARWEVESISSPGKTYIVGMKADGTWGCSCPCWKFGKAPKVDCKHIKGVQHTEPRAAASAATPTISVVESRAVANGPFFVVQTRRHIILED